MRANPESGKRARFSGVGFFQPLPRLVLCVLAVAVHARATGSATSADATQKVITGKKISAQGYEVWLETSAPTVAGQSGRVQVMLRAEKPFKCNPEYPHRFTPTASAGVRFPESPVKNAKHGPEGCTLELPFVAEKPGALTVGGAFKFSVCADDRCLLRTEQLSIALDVNAK